MRKMNFCLDSILSGARIRRNMNFHGKFCINVVTDYKGPMKFRGLNFENNIASLGARTILK